MKVFAISLVTILPKAKHRMSWSRLVRSAPIAGSLLVLVGLGIIWAARLTLPVTAIYVSELGAPNEPTAGAFSVALLCIAAGGFTIAACSSHIRSRVRWLAVWIPAVSLAFASACFVVASQVTCSAGCPVPIADARSTPGDLIHTVFAVLGFAAACFAMLQIGFAHHRAGLARLSIVSGVAVSLITITGGMLSIVQFDVSTGAWLEFAGMTIAIGWVAALGVVLAVQDRPRFVSDGDERAEPVLVRAGQRL